MDAGSGGGGYQPPSSSTNANSQSVTNQDVNGRENVSQDPSSGRTDDAQQSSSSSLNPLGPAVAGSSNDHQSSFHAQNTSTAPAPNAQPIGDTSSGQLPLPLPPPLPLPLRLPIGLPLPGALGGLFSNLPAPSQFFSTMPIDSGGGGGDEGSSNGAESGGSAADGNGEYGREYSTRQCNGWSCKRWWRSAL